MKGKNQWEQRDIITFSIVHQNNMAVEFLHFGLGAGRVLHVLSERVADPHAVVGAEMTVDLIVPLWCVTPGKIKQGLYN